ncbi:AAA family ATPase [uncultured Treponema sp.]|uniref:McrB family protein n=1 Tax=uncultured Treponema sp. TaxID=162155 RepID=UPI0025951FFA|nr:AAA family ATPase [uncultured Treponema sp.]
MEEIYKKTVNENGICFCNKEELNMTNPKDFDGERTEFTWIPFYEEIAKKLLEYKNKRSQLIEILYSSLKEAGLSSSMYKSDETEPLKNIDPLTFIGSFNRGNKREDRIKLANIIAGKLGLKNRLSDNEQFLSIPILNSQKSTLFFKHCPEEDYDKLWNLFEKALSYSFEKQGEFAESFDLALTVKGTAQSYATMTCYWINPYKILSVDKNNTDLLEEYGIKVPSQLSGKEYLSLLNKVTEKIQDKEIKEKSIPEFSLAAWNNSKQIQGDTKMPEQNNISQYINLLKENRNLILHGAPGTGKTFLAKKIAEGMNAKIDFCQFHPSYDYTDFVEGLRPVKTDDASGIGFERKDGVFKEFCKMAILNQTGVERQGSDNFEEAWKSLVEKLDEVNVIDIPLLSGKGTFPIELNEYGTGLASRTYKTETRDEWIPGKSKFFNKDQLYNIYKGLPGTPAEGHDNYRKAVVKKMKEDFGLKDYIEIIENKSDSKNQKPFVFIIDEINRGELSKIFGELFFSIDPGYRGLDEDGKQKGIVNTQYQNLLTGTSDIFANGFFIPENVYIIGTMNDIDRSVESMDFAMRRRFIFKEVTAEESAENMNLGEEAKSRMTRMNEAISKTEGLNSSYFIGGSYFLGVTDFDKLWDLKLSSLITEYLRGMDDDNSKYDRIKDAYFGNETPNN